MSESNNSVQERLFHYATQICFWLLKPMGAWPLHSQATVLEIITYASSIVISTLLQLFMIVPWYISIIVVNWSFYDLVRIASPFIYSQTVFVRYLFLLYHRDEIRSCIDRIAEDWRNVTLVEHREIMLTNAKSGRLYGIISVTLMFVSGMAYCMLPILLPSVSEDNITIRSLPTPCELIFVDVQVSPAYEVIYVLELFSSCAVFSVFCGTCSLTTSFVMHACGQFEILMYFFEELIDKNNNEDQIDWKINTVVKRHLRILRFVSDVDKVLNEICLAEFLNSSINICLEGYYVSVDLKNDASMINLFTFFFAFLSLTFNIYIFCYIGEQLVDRCQKIGTTCYMIEWYRLPYNKARCLMFSILMSNYPVEITAGKMIKMTMSSFSNILKISMTYFNLLREVSSRDTM